MYRYVTRMTHLCCFHLVCAQNGIFRVALRKFCLASTVKLLVFQLMRHVSFPPPLTCDPARLVEEFPRWLEKVSSKLPGGVILVLDSIHSVQVPTRNATLVT